MATKRSYDDGCPSAHTLDLVGERWALLIVRELLYGAKRFTDLRTGLPGASPNILTQRLRELHDAGILHRRTLPPPAATRVYELTPRGRELQPVIAALGRWGARSPQLPHDAPISVDSLMLALHTLYDPHRAGELTAQGATHVALQLGEETVHTTISPDQDTLHVTRNPTHGHEPHVVIHTDTTTLNSVIQGRQTLTDAHASGHLTVDGDTAVANRFVTLFPFSPATA
jgi:DNA-binding HxlR family transcriptional regulator